MTTTFVLADRITNAILLVRGEKVLLDADLAFLYGVETKALVRAPTDVRALTTRLMTLTSHPMCWLSSRWVMPNGPRNRLPQGSYKFTATGIDGLFPPERANGQTLALARVRELAYPGRPSMRSAPLVLAASALLGAGCSHAPWNPYGGWTVVRSKHVSLYTDTKYLHSTTLESLEVAYTALWASLFPTRGIAPVEVLFLQAPLFQSTFGHFRNGVAVAKLPGRGQLGRRGLVVLAEDSFVPRAAHKLAHLFLHAVAPGAPLWLHESYATYAETIEYRSGGGSQVACLGKLNPTAPQVTLEELFSWSWSQYDDSKKAEWYGNAGRTVLDYFLAGEKGALRERFAAFVADVARGTDTKQALAAAFPGLTVAELEKKMMDHRRGSEVEPDSDVQRRGLCPITFPIQPARVADLGKPRVAPVEKEDIEQLVLRLRLLPRRAGYVDWYPPHVVTLEGLSRS